MSAKIRIPTDPRGVATTEKAISCLVNDNMPFITNATVGSQQYGSLMYDFLSLSIIELPGLTDSNENMRNYNKWFNFVIRS